ncbi:MAG: sulfite exporter TauE/SafE family protein [Bdellovibrionales bacterium]|nr:sulfite exporter TauE/SafE family protein [Bdellovibrionales bacterium]
MNLLAILVASLAGSAHCAGMCGGFVGYLCGNSQSPVTVQSVYHIGRLLAYLCIGALAGVVGSQLDAVTKDFSGFQHVTAVLVGILLIYWGVQTIRGKQAVSNATFSWLKPLHQLYRKVYKSPVEDTTASWCKRGFLLGLFSSFLPCGWLYAYALVATSAGSIPLAMLVMFFFWIGTVPALFGVGMFGSYISKLLGSRAPIIVGGLLIVVGLVSIGLHSGLPMFVEPARHCH